MSSATAFDAFRLDGKIAAITGGARGIGRAAAQALAAAGAAIALLDRDAAGAEAAAKAIAGASALGGGAVSVHAADVAGRRGQPDRRLPVLAHRRPQH